ncbi:MAG: DEAD/DEAH box helicase [Actinobacteria bacterium]|nr:DEAD/DEAH box helicase [Actinomycetota bacterium]
MTAAPITQTHEELLSRLEREELNWLSWGRVDGALSHAEVEAAADLVLRDSGDPSGSRELIDDLLDHHLLIDLGHEPPRYRTRFGESVRLFARLRQLTPARDYRQAPQLVNDFRVLARPRTFPRREIEPAEAIDALADGAPLRAGERIALDAMLGGPGPGLLLSRFQLEAAIRIRRELLDGRRSATIVCAGTGSGKTKAFYLPTLTEIAADSDSSRWARVLAIYPRNELLKDQLAEALSQVELIAAAGGPVLAVGALFGPTAWSAQQVARDARGPSRGWRVTSGGYACRYVRCPQGCSEDLVWLSTDLASGSEILECPSCAWRSRQGQLALTRSSINAQTPHVLFTTTEMLNRGLSDAEMRPTFVGASSRRPRVLLLDEVHTYGGTHGAQVALLLRRWRNALGRDTPLHIVGLSATLESPSGFMSKITGLTDVHEISPRDDDLELRSGEYALVLRGNPVSGTALLSTTIQATFLMARLLESRSLRDPSGTSGSKVFAFTDDLDVTNRLYWNLRSAEGAYEGRPAPPLAALRHRDGQSDAAKTADGQVWDICPQLGHPLGAADRLSVARTSSQDAGVDPHADVIVATSSLEVGFDDPQVGAVIQHKAPRDDAAFVQRKGRAGRLQSMRPWTTVILSDYGRDRARYQGYETLFAPVLAARSIPVDNLHLLKMQAAYALLDWLSLSVPRLRARADLSEPVIKRTRWERARLDRQRRVADVIEQALTDPRHERDLARHLRYALELSEDQLQAVMWESPRALMTSVLPLTLRRLRVNWTTATPGRMDRYARDIPLPEYAPQSLFGDLNLPEVNVVAPGRRPQDPPLETAMPIVQALTEFAPGRASRRFGVTSYTLWHWVPIDNDDSSGEHVVDIETFVPVTESVGSLQVAGEAAARPLLRPWRLELSLADRQEQQSNARASWRTQITAATPSWWFELPTGSPGVQLVQGLHFHTAALGNEVEVARGVVGSAVTSADAEVKVGLVQIPDGNPRPVALGFRAAVDALRVALRKDAIPSFASLSDESRRAAVTAWFEHQVAADPSLRGKASEFSLGWLSALYLAAIAGVSVASNQAIPDLGAAVSAIDDLGVSLCLERALDAVFAADDTDIDQDDTRAMARLRALIKDADVTRRLSEFGARLASASAADIDVWLAPVIATTAAVALREACQRMCPDVDADELIIDFDAIVDPAQPDETIDVWLCEPDIGSGGTLEEIRRTASVDPGRLARLLSASLAPTDYEVIDSNVRRALRASQQPGPLATAFATVRAARTGAETTKAVSDLRHALRQEGLSADHAVISSLNLRVLRPGSSPSTDTALLDALELWDRAEQLLGIELDARTIAYASSRLAGSQLSLEQVYSLLWPRGRAARGAGRAAYSRFADLPAVDPLLVRGLIKEAVPEIQLSESASADARDMLSRAGAVRVTADTRSSAALQALILGLIGEPIEVGSVMAYPRTTGAGRSPQGEWVTLELAEALS